MFEIIIDNKIIENPVNMENTKNRKCNGIHIIDNLGKEEAVHKSFISKITFELELRDKERNQLKKNKGMKLHINKISETKEN